VLVKIRRNINAPIATNTSPTNEHIESVTLMQKSHKTHKKDGTITQAKSNRVRDMRKGEAADEHENINK